MKIAVVGLGYVGLRLAASSPSQIATAVRHCEARRAVAIQSLSGNEISGLPRRLRLLMEQLAIRLGRQKTVAKSLVIAMTGVVFRSSFRKQTNGQSRIKTHQKNPVIFDGRNLFEPSSVTTLGIAYHGIRREGSTVVQAL